MIDGNSQAVKIFYKGSVVLAGKVNPVVAKTIRTIGHVKVAGIIRRINNAGARIGQKQLFTLVSALGRCHVKEYPEGEAMRTLMTKTNAVIGIHTQIINEVAHGMHLPFMAKSYHGCDFLSIKVDFEREISYAIWDFLHSRFCTILLCSF